MADSGRTAIFIGLSMSWLVAAAAAAQGDAPSDPARAPPDALVWVGVSDVGRLREGFEKTAGYRMMNDPRAKEVFTDLGVLDKIVEKVKKRLAEAIKVEPEALKNPFGGPLSAYLLAPSGTDKAPHGVLVAGVSDAELMKDYYGRIRARFREGAEEYESVDFGDSTIDVFKSPPKQAPESPADEPNSPSGDPNEVSPLDAGENPLLQMVDEAMGDLLSGEKLPERLAACLTERFLILGESAEDVKDVLRRLRGGDSLRDSDSYKALERRFEAAGPLRFVVNVPRLIGLVPPEDKDARAGIESMGVGGVGAIVGHADFGREDYDQKVEAFVPISGQRSGLVKILSMANSEIAPPKEAGRDACLFGRVNIDPPALLDEVERMIRQTDPAAADRMRRSLEEVPVSEAETLNLRKELLNHLRPPLTFMFAVAMPVTPDAVRLRIAIGQENQAAVTRSLEVLASLAPGLIIPREFRGTMVYDVPFASMSFAAGGSRLVAGTSAAVEAVLQESGEGQGLADDPEFRRLAGLTARECSALFYFNARQMFDATLELARRDVAINPASPASMILFGLREQMVHSIKDGKYEEARQLRKYQRPSLTTLSTAPDGLLLQSVQLGGESE